VLAPATTCLYKVTTDGILWASFQGFPFFFKIKTLSPAAFGSNIGIQSKELCVERSRDQDSRFSYQTNVVWASKSSNIEKIKGKRKEKEEIEKVCSEHTQKASG